MKMKGKMKDNDLFADFLTKITAIPWTDHDAFPERKSEMGAHSTADQIMEVDKLSRVGW